MKNHLLKTSDDYGTGLIRLMVGIVFTSEGIQKFLFPNERGTGRFEELGFPFPDLFGYFIGSIEIFFGLLLLFGLFTRISSVTILLLITAAFFTTKVSVFDEFGFWAMMHGSRTDLCMFMGSLFLIYKGGGFKSFDQYYFKKYSE
ncbi:DoxX family protein [Flammeovirga sp. MY04]|uniref:DoxX family protein n=1 Tax=Flammeovirga sp. MY04 TaxID=1191459 RepID=UPI0008063492|nr:DoxX family protein [Flammeovirga sp. MY04]